jgi:hypothetical protein
MRGASFTPRLAKESASPSLPPDCIAPVEEARRVVLETPAGRFGSMFPVHNMVIAKVLEDITLNSPGVLPGTYDASR